MLVWAAVISLLSSDAFSGDHTGSFLLPLLDALLPGASPQTLLVLHGWLRKLAHVTEFAILAILVLRALERPQRPPSGAVGLALLLCAAYAAFDELHQSFVPTRVGSPLDALLDVAGAAVGLATRLALRAMLSAGRRSPA